MNFEFNDACVCGGTKKAPNPECERCRFVMALAEARKPKRIQGKPRCLLVVAGDWLTVIGTFGTAAGDEAYERLLSQKPLDEEQAEYGQYRMEFQDQLTLRQLIQSAVDSGLAWSIAMELKSESASIYMATDDHLSRSGAFVIGRV